MLLKHPSHSLKRRLLSSNLILLLSFVLLTGLALEQAVVQYAQQAQEEKLRGLIYALLGATELNEQGQLIIFNNELPDRNLLAPSSGFYAAIFDQQKQLVWQSPSLLQPAQIKQSSAVGKWQFEKTTELFTLQFGVSWLHNDAEHRFTLLMQQESKDFEHLRQQFRQTLFLWLGLFSLLLMLLQWRLLNWGLKPLSQLSLELTAIKKGEQPQIEKQYPQEVQPLTEGINTLIKQQQQQQNRYQHALANLAHSLKTPLAVLRGIGIERVLQPENQQRLNEQVERMDQIVRYQLRKAATAGRQGLHQKEALLPVLQQLSRVLTKVYADKQIRFSLPTENDLTLSMEKGDLMELLGNLLDNACKHCQQQVSVSVNTEATKISLHIDDDGAGFPESEEKTLLQRGVRADRRQEGQGIGLAVAEEIVLAYEGSIELESAPLGGARVTIQLHP
ncbi:MAG: ATP-binding protein [Gammaproteobacteria bacterium]|nr:ATP-binding protein [Gammaproteobacteria bacterium]